MLFLAPAELRAVDLDELLERRDCVVAFGEGELRGRAAAVLLFADYAVVRRGATLALDSGEAWAAAAWRLGRGALRWHVQGEPVEEIVDEITDAEAGEWRRDWTRHRSVMALDSAASLIRMRGGDALERAAFASLFAVGEPQKGLGAFLAKQRPSYSLDPGEKR